MFYHSGKKMREGLSPIINGVSSPHRLKADWTLPLCTFFTFTRFCWSDLFPPAVYLALFPDGFKGHTHFQRTFCEMGTPTATQDTSVPFS